MEILINSQQEILYLKNRKIKENLKRVLKDLDCHDKELSLLFTDDKRISQLNFHYLERKGPTNVLAFSMSGKAAPEFESIMLGDVVISVETALRESKELGETPEYTIYRLLIHGVLHLLGYDHERTPEDAVQMAVMEKRLMSLIGEETDG